MTSSSELIGLAEDAEARTNIICTETSLPEIDAHQSILENIEGALEDGQNAVDARMDELKKQLADLGNEWDLLEARRKAIKRCWDRAKRAAINIHVARKQALYDQPYPKPQ